MALVPRENSFIQWQKHIEMPYDIEWLLLGDFNLLQKPADRNRPRYDILETLPFKYAISSMGLVELSLHGKDFT